MTTNQIPDANVSPTGHVPGAPSRRRGRGKIRLLTREHVDGRTFASKQFAAIVDGITSDLGGQDKLSSVRLHLIEAFAGSALVVQDLNAKLLLGAEVDLTKHSNAVSTMVRLASRIGLKRKARDAQTLEQYLKVPAE